MSSSETGPLRQIKFREEKEKSSRNARKKEVDEENAIFKGKKGGEKIFAVRVAKSFHGLAKT